MDLKFYFSLFLRRLHYFLVVSTVIAAAAVTAAMTLPPAFESRTQLLVESPQIPEELAPSTVRTPPVEQLQIMERKLLTRENMLDIARRLNVLDDIDTLSADEIVNAMRARTTVLLPRGRSPVPLMTIVFEASRPRVTAEVLNEYLILIQQEDLEFRQGRAGDTLEFFEQEVERLGQELDAQSALILSFQQGNTSVLPNSLDFRMSQQALLQERLGQVTREIAGLRDQRARLVEMFEQTGGVAVGSGGAVQIQEPPPDPDQERLDSLEADLDEALSIYSAENPRVVLLRSRIAQLETKIAEAAIAQEVAARTPSAPEEAPTNEGPTLLDVQLNEIDSRVAALLLERDETERRIAVLTESIERTPEVAITLQELNRRYDTIQAQYNEAEDRLSQARTGDVIETRSRGQRITVIEQPAVPTEPTKPARLKIAAAGVALGIMAGVGLIVLLEMLNTTARRPEDLVAKFGITPFTTIPYIRTRTQTFVQRSLKLALILAILGGVPAAVFAVHTYYLPLDLLADKIMDRVGIRL
ncbi:MAG: lipopolysaccharide biosynthesis protein [Pseudomonadota bacterium]